ncbi:MAG TPA: SAM-dependent methyltransferase, partial [Alphaproteobacteria bacterium]
MSGLGAHLERLIALKGPLSLAEFMLESLWHPSEGYYARSAAIGRSGDYVTAPEISQMFGELVGVWCVATWIAMGRPVPFELIELGPGRGTMMADALRAAGVERGFHQAARIHLVEASVRLREMQRPLAQDRAVIWHDNFGTVPAGPTI